MALLVPLGVGLVLVQLSNSTKEKLSLDMSFFCEQFQILEEVPDHWLFIII